ncbi:MAG: Aspartyl/glutamyl-tRNA(Asn/Gln) amidotransferase subunit B [Candidatus Woesebacteria bacterium GW2011_GWB1_45_5]|uniref:Aspartyl/glutamyl-tRNA(Asn/Gln) amidotransferase subunit B n=1 Tax=Candidatus Woesebacteria bacterium GW2011_GWB1_45_5 TaxID=1618581 RepID=A0A0G1QL55_9BACT|nr:MAG: Aspartyl/glutamyl-tRNA(Asn/Gln) amidotransferase subunit B [Candidatus Woesebacteria bacterium GW2011_GWB1_45_5]
MNKNYILIIGLEIHIEPKTQSKMFCACPQDHFGKKPNTQTCPVCLGLPGALPFANREGISKAIRLGLALGSEISKFSKFYRKNYFYPDLPKGYQTSQLDSPLCLGGSLKGIRLNHIHLEEDAGKLVHETLDGKKCSLIDFNRSGCALIEIVTEPDFRDTASVISFVKEIQLIARYLDISNADMEKGSMRLEANISMSPDGSLPDYKVELKNINSFKFLDKAMNAELARQEKALVKGEKLLQETRGYDEMKQITYSQRTKAEANDYRYFPEADLPPMRFTDEEIRGWKESISELPDQKRERFGKEYNLPKDFTEILVSDKARADYFEEAAKLNNNYKVIADLMINKKLDSEFPEPAGLIRKILELTNIEFAPLGDTQVAVSEVLGEHAKAVSDYKNGKGEVVGFLIGMVQKKLKGKGNTQTVRKELIKNLNV